MMQSVGGGKHKGLPSAHTVQAYVGARLKSYFFFEIKRFDIKGKECLRTLGKYDIVDVWLRNFLLGFRNRDSGRAVENVVSTSNRSAGAMTWPSGRSTIRRRTSSSSPPTTSSAAVALRKGEHGRAEALGRWQ